jgi:hypothetical protein
MSQEWLRSNHSTTNWACFNIFDNRIDVLAVIGPTERIHRTMSREEARALWNELRLRGWHHASDEEINDHEMSHKKLLGIAYG